VDKLEKLVDVWGNLLYCTDRMVEADWTKFNNAVRATKGGVWNELTIKGLWTLVAELPAGF
jgi:hypothetical protein